MILRARRTVTSQSDEHNLSFTHSRGEPTMKFNKQKKTAEDRRKRNFEGGEAFEPATAQNKLLKNTINNLLEDTFYQTDEEQLQDLMETFDKAVEKDAKFPLQLAIYARQEMYLRDVSQMLLVLAANHDEAKQYVREAATQVIDRADEINTVTAMQLELFGKPIPKPLKKGLADSFTKFDEYQFAKYNDLNKEVKFRDVINLVHPDVDDEETNQIIQKITRGQLDNYPEVDELETPETWEVEVSEAVKQVRQEYEDETPEEAIRDAKKEAYEDLLENNKMGMFAKIRNLRNMMQVGVSPETILDGEDLDYVKSDRCQMYPFRFYQAYKALKDEGINEPYLEDWLSDAVDATAENLPDYMTDTMVGVDLSGSMSSAVSNRSDLRCDEIASLFGAVLMSNGAELGVFASTYDRVRAHNQTPTLELKEKINSSNVGSSTNGWKVIRDIYENEEEYDRVVILTDMQIWDSTGYGTRDDHTVKEMWEKYKAEVNPDASLYMVDLQSYGDLVTPEGYSDVYNLQGWNTKVIDWIEHAENEDEMLREIQQVELG